MARAHRRRRVFFGEDDASGFIYFPTYFHYMSEGEQELLAACGLDFRALQAEHGVTAPTVHAECDCRAPARSGDVLDHDVTLTFGGRSTFTTAHVFTCSGRTVAEGVLVHSFIGLAHGRSIPVPDFVRTATSHPGPDGVLPGSPA